MSLEQELYELWQRPGLLTAPPQVGVRGRDEAEAHSIWMLRELYRCVVARQGPSFTLRFDASHGACRRWDGSVEKWFVDLFDKARGGNRIARFVVTAGRGLGGMATESPLWSDGMPEARPPSYFIQILYRGSGRLAWAATGTRREDDVFFTLFSGIPERQVHYL